MGGCGVNVEGQALAMQIKLKPIAGESKEVEVSPQATIADLKVTIETTLGIPISEQRLIYAGTQLEETASVAWLDRQRAAGGVLSVALGNAQMAVGSPMTLEHYAIQKGSAINIVRRIAVPETPSEPGGACGPVETPTLAGLASELGALSDRELRDLLVPILRTRPALQASLMTAAGTPAAPQRVANPQREQFKKGDLVSVWSNSSRTWRDGTVASVASVPNGHIPQGAIEVEFDIGKKWIAPMDVGRALRPR